MFAHTVDGAARIFFCFYWEFARHTIFSRCLVPLFPITTHQRERDENGEYDNKYNPTAKFLKPATDSREVEKRKKDLLVVQEMTAF